MAVTEKAWLRQSIIDKLEGLSADKLAEVLAFVDLVKQEQGHPPVLANLPAPDAFLNLAGSWQFEPGEFDEILQDIEQARLLELEENDSGLLD